MRAFIVTIALSGLLVGACSGQEGLSDKNWAELADQCIFDFDSAEEQEPDAEELCGVTVAEAARRHVLSEKAEGQLRSDLGCDSYESTIRCLDGAKLENYCRESPLDCLDDSGRYDPTAG